MFLILAGLKGSSLNLDNSRYFLIFIGKCLKAEVNIFAKKNMGDIFMKDNVNIGK